jgi:serralysin
LEGNDSLDGGTGNDTYYAVLGDVLSDAGGLDLVIASSWTLGGGFENLTLTYSAFRGSGAGNDLDNVIDGRDAYAAGLSGGGGNDTLYGSDGIVLDAGRDGLSGGDGDDELHGGANDDGLNGDAGNDLLFGDDGDDGIFGGPGNDTMFGGAGDDHFFLTGAAITEIGQDSVDGGAGFDTLQYRSLDSSAIVVDFTSGTAVGGGPGGSGRVTFSGIERISATQFADRMTGDANTNYLIGREGNDTLDGRAGVDVLEGGAGADSFLFTVAPADENADHVFDFATSEDKIQLDSAVYTNIGTAGNFSAGDERFFAGADVIIGQDSSDRIIYNTSDGSLWYDADGNGAGASQRIAILSTKPALVATDIAVMGGSGSTTINGTAGNDSLTGGAGNDTINGLDGNDTINGLDGNDSLTGGSGIDIMNGGLGNDTYVVGTGDVLSDSGGIDTVRTDVTWSLGLEFENLTMTGTGNITMQGNNLDNLIIGNGGSNTFNARAGDDTIMAGGGNDRIDMFGNGFASYGAEVVDGGTGIDTMDFSGYAKTGIVVNLGTGQITGGGDAGSGTVAVSNVERVTTGAFNDRFTGDSGANLFDGRGGNDTLSGGGGNDTLTGGTGNDFFVFDTAPGSGNVERITDFSSAPDQLQFENAIFTAIGAAGTLAAGDGRFWAAAGATSGHDANDRVVYNVSTGSLYYDADGSGAGASQLIATFQGNPTIAATDITVI